MSKYAPVRRRRQRFCYAFEIGYSTTDEQIEDKVDEAKKRISHDIRIAMELK